MWQSKGPQLLTYKLVCGGSQSFMFMFIKKLFFIVTCAMAIFVTSCDKDPVPSPEPTPTPEDDFKIEVLETTATSVSFRISPNDMEMRYVVMMTPKSNYDELGDDQACINDDLSWFDNLIISEGISAEEFYERELKKGIVEDSQINLKPDTEYYIYAYGMTTNGIVTTKLYKELFKTSTVELKEVKFDIEITDIGYDEAKVVITPEQKDIIYFVNVFSDEDYEKWGGNETAYANQLLYVRDYYLSMGATTDQMLANLCYAGDKNITVNNLKAGTHYTAYAIAVNSDFIAVSTASTASFNTLEANSTELTFECNITDIQYDRICGTLTPSNNEDTYICTVQYAESASWYGSDEEFIENIVMDIDMWQGGIENALRTGVTSLDNIGGLTANKEYIIVCFGFDGAATTPLYTFPFTTPDANGNPEDLIVELTITDITHNSVNVTSDPSVGAYYFVSYVEKASFDEAVLALGSSDLAVAYFANNDIDYGAEFFDSSRADYLYEIGAILGRYTSYFNQLNPSTEYIAFAIAVDIESGELASTRGFVSEPFTTLDKVLGSAKVEFSFSNYYDGSALAELDPSKYLNCKGYAVVPYTITPNDEAMTWYTGFYEGDYTEWGCTDDDIYAELITYGYEWGSDMVSVDSTGGIAVLSYNTAFTFLGIAQDWEENFGAGTMQVVTFSRDGVSPAEEFIAAQNSTPTSRPSKSALKR